MTGITDAVCTLKRCTHPSAKVQANIHSRPRPSAKCKK